MSFLNGTLDAFRSGTSGFAGTAVPVSCFEPVAFDYVSVPNAASGTVTWTGAGSGAVTLVNSNTGVKITNSTSSAQTFFLQLMLCGASSTVNGAIWYVADDTDTTVAFSVSRLTLSTNTISYNATCVVQVSAGASRTFFSKFQLGGSGSPTWHIDSGPLGVPVLNQFIVSQIC